MSTQKAFCKDYGRLASALQILANKIRSIPEPSDGASGVEPPPGSHGGFPMGEEPPGVHPLGYIVGSTSGYYIVEDYEDAVVLVDELGGDGHAGIECFAWKLLNAAGSSYSTGADAADLHSTFLYAAWYDARQDGLSLLAYATEAAAWIALALEALGSGTDNTATRDALQEALESLGELQTAFAQTVKKWREH